MLSSRRAGTLTQTALSLGVALLVVVPAGATAQEPGVIRDPDSPAGKEYALPFDSARRLGAGPDAPREEGVAPPFGIGIRPPGGGAGDGGTGGSGERRNEQSRGGGGERAGPLSRLPAAGDLDGGGTSGVTLAILAAVLLGGALVGVTLRAASRSSGRPA